jgi:radical SAM superfamily enzyme YgiQ (UPF0313 family)
MYYPIWLAYATGVLEQAGFNVRLVDAPAAGRDLRYVLDVVEDLRPRLIVIDTSTPSIYNDVEVAGAIKAVVPETFVVLVGPHVSALSEESLAINPAVNAVARREYEYTLRDLAQVLDGGGDLSSVEGLSYRAPDGIIVHNPDRELIKDLDALPFVSEVYKRHLRIEDYFYSITRYPEVTIITGRGCPHRCVYCMWPQTLHGRGYRRRSPENVAEEFEFIQREFPQVKEIFIEDDTLTVNRKHVQRLSEELIRRNIRMPFTANSRADVDYETLRLLKAAGCRLLCVGFESGDQGVLDAMHKGVKVEQFYKFRRAAQKAGILVHGCFMVGNPGETKETMQKTLELAKALNPDTAQFFPLMVYPGTEAYEWAKRNGYLVTKDFRQWLTADGLHRSLVTRPGLTAEELVAFCDYARRSFYMRPRYILSKALQAVSHPSEAKRIFKSAKTFIRYLFRSSLSEHSHSGVTNARQ